MHRSIPGLAAVALLLCCVAGCARGPAARGDGWYSVRTAHVRLSSDAAPERAVDHAWRLEDVHLALAHLFPACAQRAEATEVVLLARHGEYEEIAPEGSAGFFDPGGAGLYAIGPRIVMSERAARANGTTELFVHELTHRFVAACYPDAPVWLHEGLAELFETLRIEDEGLVLGTAQYRIADTPYVTRFMSGGRAAYDVPERLVPRPSALFEMRPSAFYQPTPRDAALGAAEVRVANYAGAWALLHMLRLGDDRGLRARLQAYLGALELGQGDGRAALEQAFEGYPLDSMLEAHVASRELVRSRVRYRAPVIPRPTVEPMVPGQAHLTWATLVLRARGEEGRARVLELLEHARGDDRVRAGALLVRAMLERDETVRARAVRAAARAAPTDPRVLRARGMLALERGDAAEVEAISVSLAATSDLGVPERVLLAELLEARGDTEGAEANARAAVERDPGAWQARYALGRALLRLGQRAEARRELRIVLHLTGDHRPDVARSVRALLGGAEE